MLFNSLQFAVFFPVVTLIYFMLGHRFRWGWLLIASSLFYMAFVPKYIWILFFIILIDYPAGILIEKSEGQTKTFWLVLSLIVNLGCLAFFKYFNFFNANVTEMAHLLHWNYSVESLNLILPIGLSFHTFQSLSYTIEVYRGNQKAERHLGIYALYVLFYPQLVAGPIERPQNLLHQFYEPKKFDFERVTDGLFLMFFGLFKKMVIADRLAVLVSQIYGHPTEYSGFPLWVATYFFGFQVYYDFSGYTDIARGAARVMGFELMENFERPYAARNISDFWRRWHISLLTWFRDYLYLPIALGGSRAPWRIYFAVMLTFFLSGLWHGAAWTFIVWGVLHGIYSIGSLYTMPTRKKLFKKWGVGKLPRLHALWQVLITFHMVTLSWVFFRAQSLKDSGYILGHIFKPSPKNFFELNLGMGKNEFIFSIFLIIAMEGLMWLHKRQPLQQTLDRKPTWLRWSIYYAVIIFFWIFSQSKTQQFIYFQF